MLSGGAVAGTLYVDANSDGRQNAGEAVLAGRTVFVDANRDAAWDNGELSVASDAAGHYQFAGLAAGSYPLGQVEPAGWKRMPALYQALIPVAAVTDGVTTRVDLGSAAVTSTLAVDGTTGPVTFQVGVSDYHHPLARQADGKLLVATFLSDSLSAGPKSALARYNADGTPDVTFGQGGTAVVPAAIEAMAVAADGRILVAGGLDYSQYAAIRLLPDGTPDPSFGTAGRSALLFGSSAGSVLGANALALSPNGSVVVVGSGGYDVTSRLTAVSRVTAGGDLDPTFGTGGTVRVSVPGYGTDGSAVAVAADGGVYVAGTYYGSTTIGGFLSRLTPYGDTDPVPYGGWQVLAPASHTVYGWSAILTDAATGKVTVAGSGYAAGRPTLDAARYSPLGEPDVTFGTAGVTTAVLPGTFPVYDGAPAAVVATDPLSRIVIGAIAVNDVNAGLVNLVRLTPAGRLDGTFGVGGFGQVSLSGGSDVPASLTANADGTVDAICVANDNHAIVGVRLATPARAGSIAGTVFADANGNGTADVGDAGVAGRTVYLDANNDGARESGEPTTATGTAGGFAFGGLSAGTYAVRQVLPAGYRQTTKAASVAVAAGAAVTGVALGTNDARPTGSAGGPYAVAEGGTVTLSAAASVPPAGGSIAKVEWDGANYTGATFVVTATGTTVTFAAAGMDGPAVVSVGLRVTDDAGNVSLTRAVVDLTDAPPTGTFAAGPAVAPGQPATVAFSTVTDPSPADIAAGFTYGYDFNDDGTIDLTTTAATAAVPAAYLLTAGAHTVRGRVSDRDGGHTDYLTTVTVVATPTPTPTPTPTATKLPGTTIGTAGSYKSSGNTAAKATDGSLSTYFDAPTASGAWVGLDLGSARAVTSVAFAPRSGFASRTVGGVVQASADPTFATGVVTAYAIKSAPTAGTLTTVAVSVPTAYRYWRYLGPANAYCDVAEFQLFGPAVARLAATTIGTAGSYNGGGNTIVKATDGSLSTYFDAPTASGAWVGLDLGAAKSVTQIKFAPRSGYASRMVGGVFQASNDATFATGTTTVYTVTATPASGTLTTVGVNVVTPYRYWRYVGPAGSYCDIAEFQLFG